MLTRDRLSEAIDLTDIQDDGDYLTKIMSAVQPNSGQASRFLREVTAEDLLDVQWEPGTYHIDRETRTEAFQAPIPGISSMVRLTDLPADTVVTLVESDDWSGYVEARVSPKFQKRVEFTTLVLGQGRPHRHAPWTETMWNLTPGDLVHPEKFRTQGTSRTVSVAQALALGLEWAKAE